MMGWYGMGVGWGTWLGMGLFWLVLLGVILYAVVRLLPARRSGARDHRSDSPEDVLNQRFAHGEIDIETCRAQRAALIDEGAR